MSVSIAVNLPINFSFVVSLNITLCELDVTVAVHTNSNVCPTRPPPPESGKVTTAPSVSLKVYILPATAAATFAAAEAIGFVTPSEGVKLPVTVTPSDAVASLGPTPL